MGKSKYSHVVANKIQEEYLKKEKNINKARVVETSGASSSSKGFALMIIAITIIGVSVYGVMVAVEQSKKPVEGAYNTLPGYTSTSGQQSTTQQTTSGNSSYGVDISLTTIEGNTIKLSQYAGKAVVLFFFYLGCYFCNEMEPELKSAADKFGSNVKIFAIDVQPNADSADELQQWRSSNGYTGWEIVRDVSGYLTNAFEVTGTPKTYYLDTNGDVYTVHLGYKQEADIEQAISGSLSQ